MRIESSTISMISSYSMSKTFSKEESLVSWADNNSQNQQGLQSNSFQDLSGAVVEISKEGASALVNQTGNQSKVDDDSIFTLSEKDKQKIALIEQLIEIMTGKKIKIRLPENIKIKFSDSNANVAQNGNSSTRPKLGWGLEYKLRESYSEQEKMDFKSNGTIKTTDGREINFDVAISMNRSFSQNTNINIRMGDASKVDPLVINYEGSTPNLTDRKFSFDIDSDGTSDQISFLTKGSGFLALDLNNDGAINDGSELFGPKSGDGFKDLSNYDSDNNNWIDENDPIFDKLRIWTKDDNGNDVLFALGEKGIGAIYLGNISTQFDFKNSTGTSNGQLQKTGIFVKEDNSVGTIQHIDLAV